MTRRDGSDAGGRRQDLASPSRSWRERLDDPDEPLYTVAVAAELLGLDAQSLRRLEGLSSQTSARPSGNQRRYSRNDLEAIAAVAEAAESGYPASAISRILELQRQVEDLEKESNDAG